MKRKSNHWINTLFKYIVTYILLAVFVVGALMPVYFVVLKKEEENKIKETYVYIENASYEFQNQLNKINSFIHNLRRNRNVVKLSLINDSEQLKNLYLLNISYYLQDTLFDNEMQSEIILQFSKNNVLLSPGRIFDNKEIFYKKFFSYEKITYKEWQDKLYLGKQYIWNSMNIIKLGHIEYSAFTINHYYPSASSPVMIASIIIPEHVLWELVMTSEIEEYGFVYLADKDSNLIASYNYDDIPLSSKEPIETIYIDNEKYTVFTIENFDYGLKIVAGLPNSVYEQAVVPIKRIIITYTIVALTIAIILSLAFAYLNYSPLRSIATFIGTLGAKNAVGRMNNNTDDKDDAYNNIYDYIKTTIADITSSKESLKQAFDTMKHTYQMKVFKDAVYGNAISESDKTALLEELKVFKDDYIVILIAFEDAVQRIEESQNREYYQIAIRKIIMDNFTNVCIYNLDNLCAVINVRANGGCEAVKDKLKNINKTLKSATDLNILFGMSTVYSSIEDLSNAYNEALKCIALVKSVAEDYVVSYDEIPHANSHNPIELSDYYLLFNLLMVGDKAGVIKFFNNISTKLYNNTYISPKRFEMIYYNIVSVLSSVVEKLPLESNINIDDEYDIETGRDKLLNQLLDTSILICNAIEEQKANQKLKLKEEVLEYLNTNFNQPDLCLAKIAEEFNISEGYASQFIKEQIGANYSQYVEELRMKEAQRLLKETHIPINEIARMVGYYNKNTFYKSFKRIYNTSPTIYRESFKDIKE